MFNIQAQSRARTTCFVSLFEVVLASCLKNILLEKKNRTKNPIALCKYCCFVSPLFFQKLDNNPETPSHGAVAPSPQPLLPVLESDLEDINLAFRWPGCVFPSALYDVLSSSGSVFRSW